jgi:hypothetical protein
MVERHPSMGYFFKSDCFVTIEKIKHGTLTFAPVFFSVEGLSTNGISAVCPDSDNFPGN